MRRWFCCFAVGLWACGPATQDTLSRDAGPPLAQDAGSQGPIAPPLPEVPAACEAELQRFSRTVHIPIASRLCIACHNEDGAASGSRLQLLGSDREGYLAHNWQALGQLGALRLGNDPVLLLRASGLHPEGHPGGALVPPSTPDYEVLAGFITDAMDPACNVPEQTTPECEAPPYGPAVLRRLTHLEYQYSVEAALQRPVLNEPALAADRVVDGFSNQADQLTVNALLADQYRTHAEDLGRELSTRLDEILPCSPAGELQDECKVLFIRDFGLRAFRRPLSSADVQRYEQLFDDTSQGDFASGVQWVVTAMLQSPHFLYRSEVGLADGQGRRQLDGFEIASQLAYFLTASPPDELLMEAARAGRLIDPEERIRQARRLAGSRRGQAALVRFFESWLDLGRLSTVPKDPGTYAGFNAQVRQSMQAETARFIAEVMWSGSGRLPELLSAPYSFADETLRSYYQPLPWQAPDAAGWSKSVDPSRHVGLLSQGGLLSVHAHANDASPIHRGKLVRERLLCQPLMPPPTGVSVELPALDPELTTRERYAAHSELEPCRSCHRLIDPIGFGFEAFDGAGRFAPLHAGEPVDASGEIVDSLDTDGRFEGLRGLAELLAGSSEVHRCFSNRLQRYAYGLSAHAGLACAEVEAYRTFADGDLQVEALIWSIVGSEHLTTRTATASEG